MLNFLQICSDGAIYMLDGLRLSNYIFAYFLEGGNHSFKLQKKEKID